MGLYRRPEDFDEDWAIRRALRRVIDPQTSHFWAMSLAACFALLITFIMIGMVLYRITRDIHISPSIQ
ncbi:MAG: hypothetical protein AAGE65_00580 [Planctomycetota bacterium]